MGTFASNVGLAVANLANQRKILFLAAEPLTDKIVWENGNRYTFRLRPSTYMQVAMLVPEAARLNKKRWAIVVPNYEYGQSAAASFRKLLTRAQPGVEFVAEQAPPLGRIDAGAVVQALLEAKPEAIFSALFAVDLQKFVREGNTRGLFKSAAVVNLLGGEPEYLDPLKDETPEGWWVTGYPWSEISTPEHRKFRDAYQKRWNDYPRLGSVVGSAVLLQFLNGLAGASSLFLVAAGLSLIFGVSRIVNFAHGSLYMLGMYLAVSLSGTLGFWLSVPLAAALVAAAGFVIETTLLRRIYKAPELLQLLATFALVLIIRDAALWAWGPEDRLVPRAPGLAGAVAIASRQFPQYDLLLICLGPAVFIALYLLLSRTRWGTRVRAATQDREMAAALGVNERRLFTAVFALGALLAGFGGASAIPREPASLQIDLAVMSDAFVVVVVGGLGSIP